MTPLEAKEPEGRRRHRKSRNGCLVCKKRRVKCDEGRPRCQNCSYADRPCSYGPERSFASRSAAVSPASPASATGSVTATRSTGLTDEPGGGEGDSTARRSFCVKGTFTIIHMNLFHHAHSHMAEFLGVRGDIRPFLDLAISSSHTEPYVLDQLLAVSSLHLATWEPHAAAAYSHEATELQTRALSAFNELRDGVTDTNYLAAFVFATLLGVHSLRNTLARSYPNLGEFVLAFINYARLHRGVRAVTDKYWHKILQSHLQPLLYLSDYSRDAERKPTGAETDSLRVFLESLPGHPSPSIQPCLSALERVQWTIDIAKLDPTRADIALQAIVAWPLLIPDDFITALYQHQPASFVVLAYYAAIIHRHKGFWVLSDAGAAIFDMIQNHVGAFWGDALSWPRMEFNKASSP